MLAFVSFPGAPLTESLIRNALTKLDESIVVTDEVPHSAITLLQYCGYDHLDHELTHSRPETVLASSYTIRKSLIRKHFLHRTTSLYIAKHPGCILAAGVPRTWDIEIAWADELDDQFADELWDLGAMLDNSPGQWYILKAGMADRGNGIRLFDSKEALRTIFEQFDGRSDTESDSGAQELVTSQLRHFVIQEYLIHPLLVNPSQVVSDSQVISHFHLRAYCIACGALTLYLWPHILALFSAVPYSSPSYDADGNLDLAPHLTNTSLQMDRGEAGVRLLTELSGCSILSMDGKAILSDSDIEDIKNQTANLLAEAFRAVLASPVHFQPLPNAFELFGADLLVTHAPQQTDLSNPRFQVHLLELNAEPAIELTGARLRWVLEDMFEAIARVCIGPFVGLEKCRWENWQVGETKEGLKKCLEVGVRGLGAW
ncbi:tubulin-tyrosine ligase family-domain-containing protein [Gautieria morchelliformis]|nr:tubulin-tyrosine ligase family-domain-containing protein [Gautieria morchelliformis]